MPPWCSRLLQKSQLQLSSLLMIGALVQAAERRERSRMQDHQLQEARAAAAAEASATSQQAHRTKAAKSRDELTRQILGNQAAAVNSVAVALQVWKALLFGRSNLHRQLGELGQQHLEVAFCVMIMRLGPWGSHILSILQIWLAHRRHHNQDLRSPGSDQRSCMRIHGLTGYNCQGIGHALLSREAEAGCNFHSHKLHMLSHESACTNMVRVKARVPCWMSLQKQPG